MTGPATVTSIWQTEAGRGGGKLYHEEGGGPASSMRPDCRLLAWISCRWTKEWGIPCAWLKGHIWLSLDGPTLETGAEIKSPKLSVTNQILAVWASCCGGVWLPGLGAAGSSWTS